MKHGGIREWGVVWLPMALVLSAGCVKSAYTVNVNPDGSGHLVVTRYFGKQAVAMFDMQRRQMQASMDEPGMEQLRNRMPKDPFFDEKALQREAKRYGADVKLVAARRVDVDGGRGSVAVYAFRNINDLVLDASPRAMYAMMSGMGEAVMDDDDDDGDGARGKGVEFSFQTGAVSRLKILLPDGLSDKDQEKTEPDEVAAADDADEMEIMETAEYAQYAGMMGAQFPAGFDPRYGQRYAENAMTHGLALAVEVSINGAIVKSDALYTNAVDKHRIVLVDVDASRQDAGAKRNPRELERRMQRFSDPEQFLNSLGKIPGSRIENKREVNIAFK